MVQTIVVSNRKGGTGKTTVSVNLAAEFAAAGSRVLLVDLDSQNHCAVGLGMKAAKGAPTAHDLFRDANATMDSAVLATAYPYLSLVPADPLFEHGSGLRDRGLLARALTKPAITDAFDLVILDTPPSLDILLINALNAAHGVIVPSVPHPLSLEGVKQLMRILFKIKSGENPDLKIYRFVPVMVAEHINQHRLISGEIAHHFGTPKVLEGIRSDIKLAESFGAGQPIRAFAPRCRAAEDFAALWREVARVVASFGEGPSGTPPSWTPPTSTRWHSTQAVPRATPSPEGKTQMVIPTWRNG